MKISGSKDTIDWYDANAEKYANDSDSVTFEDTIVYFLSKLKLKPKVLDAGCGSGRDSETLHKLGADVTGLDISRGLLEVAKKKRPGIMFVEGSFLDIPFPDETFDGIWSHASLVHLDTVEDVRCVLNEFIRVLKPGGCIYILVKKQFGEEKTAIVSDALSNHDRFFRYYTEEEITSLLEEIGFTVTEVVIEDDVHGRVEVKWIKLFANKQ